MPDYRRFYGPGLEHALHLEELERSVSKSGIKPVVSRPNTTTVRRRLALTLATLAARIDPIGVPHSDKTTKTVS